MTEQAPEGQVQSARRQAQADEAFAAYESTTIRRVALSLRAAAAELDQMHWETDTPSERRERASGCLRKLREAEWMLGDISRRP